MGPYAHIHTRTVKGALFCTASSRPTLVRPPSFKRTLSYSFPRPQSAPHSNLTGRPFSVTALKPSKQNPKMFSEIKFMNGLDPTNVKERELATAEKKSHSAKMAHRRRREKREALSQFPATKMLPTSYNTIYASEKAKHTGHGAISQPSPNSQSTNHESRSAVSSSDDKEGKDLDSIKDDTHATSRTRTSSAVSIARPPHSHVYLAFNGEHRMQTFQFYINFSGPAIAEFHSRRAGESYTRIIPQMAVSSSAVRHMLLAFASLHTQLLKDIGTNSKVPNTQSLYHYSKSLESMRKESSELELIAAAVLGYTFEVAQNNIYSAVMHIKGYRAIVENFSGSRNEYFEDLMTADHKFVKEVSSTMDRIAVADHEHETPSSTEVPGRRSVYQDHQTMLSDEGSHSSQQQHLSFTSFGSTQLDAVDRARYSLESIITGLSGSLPLTSTTQGKLKEHLNQWIEDLIECDSWDEHFAKKTGILLLFIVITALLPMTDTKPFDRLTASHLLEYIVRDITSLGDVRVEDVVYVTDMLEYSVKHTTEFLHQFGYQQRLKTLLDCVEASGPHRLYSRAWVAVKHVFYHVTSEEISRTMYDTKGLLFPTGQKKAHETKKTTASLIP